MVPPVLEVVLVKAGSDNYLVPMTREQFDALCEGVDIRAALLHDAPLEGDDLPHRDLPDAPAR